ncbi:DNA-binding transcriptional regulator, LysR family [Paenibacillus sp. UNCCL117]|uniref:LysR family transcriptional regulator n=1 Tax=unclassified Paenibacillus TaxID=185978 RepID=UPI000890EAF7|nr:MULTISPECIES: LysR family transcriptional regulator [unclassified Paenibacillus]SDD79522.1 DNA-binding transcriptional regulator, LysR family [Paenibacillus sp. cl123]SFW53219.1 DNA-binding transcriptional regulator, LysR family [Paenibacillus sp. UNCCL117]
MNINYLSLRYFMEIAKYLNFSQAAQKLHISQPGLSQQITLLEKELNFKLLYRSTRSVMLTAEGEYLFKSLLPSFENIESTLKELKAEGAVPQTTIRIATVPSAASNMVPYLLKRLKEEHPQIEFYIKETTSTQAIELVQKSEYHLAFIRTPIDQKHTIQQPLRWMEFPKHPMHVSLSGKHPAAQQEEIDLIDLKNETFLHYDPKHSPSLYYLLEHACLTAGFVPKTIGVGPEILTIANLISNGIGITLMPEDMLQLLGSYDIKAVPIKNMALYSSISAVWNNTHPSLITEAALRILKESVGDSHPAAM